MTKKYEFTGETKPRGEIELRRIRRLSDGQIGGWIENEHNLEHEGAAWVSGEAMVYAKAAVFGEARVSDVAEIYDEAEIYGNACVFGRACVFGSAWVYDNAQVYETAAIYGDALVHNNAQVYGNAEIYDSVRVYDNARVFGNATVTDNVRIWGNAQLSANAVIGGRADITGDAIITQTGDVICVTGLPYDITLINNRTICSAYGVLTFDEWRARNTDLSGILTPEEFDIVRSVISALADVIDGQLNIKPAAAREVGPLMQRRRLS